MLDEKEDLERKFSVINVFGKVSEMVKVMEERDKFKTENEEL